MNVKHESFAGSMEHAAWFMVPGVYVYCITSHEHVDHRRNHRRSSSEAKITLLCCAVRPMTVPSRGVQPRALHCTARILPEPVRALVIVIVSRTSLRGSAVERSCIVQNWGFIEEKKGRDEGSGKEGKKEGRKARRRDERSTVRRLGFVSLRLATCDLRLASMRDVTCDSRFTTDDRAGYVTVTHVQTFERSLSCAKRLYFSFLLSSFSLLLRRKEYNRIHDKNRTGARSLARRLVKTDG